MVMMPPLERSLLVLSVLLLLLHYPVWTKVQTQLDATFSSAISQSPASLVEFNVSWCTTCANATDIVEKVSANFEATGRACAFFSVDAEVNSATASAYDVQLYPTIKLFANGRVFDYEWDLTVEKLTAFIDRKLSPSPNALQSVYDAQQVVSGSTGLRV